MEELNKRSKLKDHKLKKFDEYFESFDMDSHRDVLEKLKLKYSVKKKQTLGAPLSQVDQRMATAK